jgi:hypothetical protein
MLKTLKSEINLMVKTADLPAYTAQTVTLNQYNRKKVVQYQHKYTDITIKFNDDNMGLINQVWQAYYKYYYQDPKASESTSAYKRNATKKSSFITSTYGYSGPSVPFFNYITIYQMARHEFVSYKLINPVISSWTGNKLDYAGKESHDFDMKLQYEAVYYDTGLVSEGKMEGFADTHYDWTPSPLAKTPGTSTTSSSPTFAKSSFSKSATGNTVSNTTGQTSQGLDSSLIPSNGKAMVQTGTVNNSLNINVPNNNTQASVKASAVNTNTSSTSVSDVNTKTSSADVAKTL